MAQKILKDLYPEISIEHPIAEIEFLKTDSLYSLVSKRRELSSEGWRNYVGYTKNGETIKWDSISATKTEVEKLDKAIENLMSK